MNRKHTYLGRILQVTEEHEDIVDAVLTKGRELGPQKAGLEYSPAITQLDSMLRRDGIEQTFSWLEMIAHEMQACDIGEDDALHASNRGEAIPPTYGFHKIDAIYESGHTFFCP